MISKIDHENLHLIDGKIGFWSDKSHVHLALFNAPGLKIWCSTKPDSIELGVKMTHISM